MPQDQPLICKPNPTHVPTRSFLQLSPCFSLLPWPPCGHALSPKHTHPQGQPALTPSSVTFLSILQKAAQYQAQKVIIKASLAPFGSAVRVVWRPRSGSTCQPLIPDIPYLQEHLCKRMTWTLEPSAPIFTSPWDLGQVTYLSQVSSVK